MSYHYIHVEARPDSGLSPKEKRLFNRYHGKLGATLVVEEWNHSNLPTDPCAREKNLWACCLNDGVVAALRGKPDEIDWLLNEDDHDRPGSFLWICDRLEIDGNQWRARIMKEWPDLVARSKKSHAMDYNRGCHT